MASSWPSFWANPVTFTPGRAQGLAERPDRGLRAAGQRRRAAGGGGGAARGRHGARGAPRWRLAPQRRRGRRQGADGAWEGEAVSRFNLNGPDAPELEL